MPTPHLLFEVLELKQKFLALFIFSLKYAGLFPVHLVFPCTLKCCLISLVRRESHVMLVIFTECWRSDLCSTMDSSEETGGSSAEENYFVNYTFTDRSHSGRVAQGIMKLCLEDELFADVTISVEGKEFQLHRLVLSAQSCFFRSMFTSNLKEAHNRVIELQDVSESVFQLLVDYIYHGTVKLRAEELQETYEVADMYQLTALFEECSRFLARTVQVRNCLQVMWLADQHSDVELYTAAKHCAKSHLSQLQDTEEFLHLPLRLLTDILAGKSCCGQAGRHREETFRGWQNRCRDPSFPHPCLFRG